MQKIITVNQTHQLRQKQNKILFLIAFFRIIILMAMMSFFY